MEVTDYKKLGDIEHVLLRPATYIGGIDPTDNNVWAIKNGKAAKITHRYPLAIEHVVGEAVANACDNVFRTKTKAPHIPVGKIVQTVSEEKVSVYNEGVWIPVEKHPVEQVYIPELMFFNLRSSSNYDDSKQRTWIGQNGLGAATCGIFSKKLILTCADPKQKLLYTQVCEKNMSIIHPPQITENYTGVGYTKVEFWPDFPRFKMTGFDPEVIAVMEFTAASMSYTTKVPYYFNDKLYNYSSIGEYSQLLVDNSTPKENILSITLPGIELCLIDTPDAGVHVSFVNGGYTRKGGEHVNVALKLLTSNVLEVLNKKEKTFTLRDIKKHLTIILSVTVDKPNYTSQFKEEFVGPAPKFIIDDKILRKIATWDFVKSMSYYAEIKKEEKNRAVRKGRKTYVKIPKFIDANEAGEPGKSQHCMFGVTEGDSAATFWLRLTANFEGGMDRYGGGPLKGKGLNVMKASDDKIANNVEIQAIRQVLGICPGLDYSIEENRKTLRYGLGFAMCTDADTDGDHIKSLLLTLFGTSYMSLLKIGYVYGVVTPLYRVTKAGKPNLYFYTESALTQWEEENKALTGVKIERFKGLGSWEKWEFKDISKFKLVVYTVDDLSMSRLKMAMDSGQEALRKAWVVEPSHELVVFSDGQKLYQPISNLVDSSLRTHAKASCTRAIPHYDAFTETQRKIFYASRLKKSMNTTKIKVAQFQGYVAEHTEFEHGENSIGDTIIRMMYNHVGSNNIPFLLGEGEFGTRKQNGKDASSTRYIYVRNNPLVNEYLYRPEDDLILQHKMGDDRSRLEPYHYVPILCSLLFNHRHGIGFGFATNSPAYNPMDISRWTKCWIQNNHPVKPDIPQIAYPPLIPWYRGFKGYIKKANSKHSYSTEGVYRQHGNVIFVTELPIGMSYMDYSEQIDEWIASGQITDAKRTIDVNGDKTVFELVNFQGTVDAKTLKLQSSVSTSNLHFFDKDGNICKFDSPEALLEDYCKYRYSCYELRKDHTLCKLETEYEEENTKIKFLKDIVVDKVFTLDDPNVEQIMKDRNHPSSLLSMKLTSITLKGLLEHEKKLAKIQTNINDILKTSSQEMWLKEILEFDEEYNRVYGLRKVVLE